MAAHPPIPRARIVTTTAAYAGRRRRERSAERTAAIACIGDSICGRRSASTRKGRTSPATAARDSALLRPAATHPRGPLLPKDERQIVRGLYQNGGDGSHGSRSSVSASARRVHRGAQCARENCWDE